MRGDYRCCFSQLTVECLIALRLGSVRYYLPHSVSFWLSSSQIKRLRSYVKPFQHLYDLIVCEVIPTHSFSLSFDSHSLLTSYCCRLAFYLVLIHFQIKLFTDFHHHLSLFDSSQINRLPVPRLRTGFLFLFRQFFDYIFY